jgi:hypothetical protein
MKLFRGRGLQTNHKNLLYRCIVSAAPAVFAALCSGSNQKYKSTSKLYSMFSIKLERVQLKAVLMQQIVLICFKNF